MTKVLTDEQVQQMISEYRQGDSTGVLGNRYGITRWSIRGLLERREIPRHPVGSARTIPLDESAFDNITEHSAYWAGFLMADGCISYQDHHSPAIILILSAQDEAHLERFRAFLKSDHKIRKYSRTDSFSTNPKVCYQVRSRRLVSALSRFGITAGKSTLGYVRHLDTNRHFWRGLIDGDGSLFETRKKYLGLALCGTETLLEQFDSFIRIFKPDAGSSIRFISGTFVLRCNTKTSRAVAKHLYQNCSVYLPRKKTIVDGWNESA